MRMIPLTRGQVALVDDSDYEWLSQWKWCTHWNPKTKSYYACRADRAGQKQKTVWMHRLILGLELGDKRQGDHINHNTCDNTRDNLRIVTNSQNQFNRDVKGYWWSPAEKKFKASIWVDGKAHYLGRFDTGPEAHEAYLNAKATFHVITNCNQGDAHA